LSGDFRLTTASGAGRLPSERAGAPPVRGKGACSHPTWFARNTNLHSGPDSADSGQRKEGCMTRKITPATSLENLKKQAKRWLKELSANHPEARALFERAYPNAPA